MATVSVSELPRHDFIPLVHRLFTLHPLLEGLFPLSSAETSNKHLALAFGADTQAVPLFSPGMLLWIKALSSKIMSFIQRLALPMNGLMLSSLPLAAETILWLYLFFFHKCNSLCGTEEGGGWTVDNSLIYLPL